MRILVLTFLEDGAEQIINERTLGDTMAELLAGNDVTVAHFEDLFFDLKSNEMKASVAGESVTEFDHVIFYGAFARGLRLAHPTAVLLNKLGVSAFTYGAETYKGADKLTHYIHFASAGAPMPHTLCGDTETMLANAGESLGFPLIAKDILASMGERNYLVSSQEDLEAMRPELEEHYFVLQQYVENHGEARIILDRNDTLFSFKKESQEHTHLNNTSQGAEVSTFDVPDEMRQTCADLLVELDIPFAGFDVLLSNDGSHYFIEANLQPQLLTGAFIEEKKQVFRDINLPKEGPVDSDEFSVLEVLGYDAQDTKVVWNYRINGASYSNVAEFADALSEETRSDPAFQHILRYCGVLFGIYLYNVAFMDRVQVPWKFSDVEKDFFEQVLTDGLAEFKYVNDIRPDTKIRLIESDEAEEIATFEPHTSGDKGLVLNGGGKDSVVGAHIAAEAGMKLDSFVMNDHPSRVRLNEHLPAENKLYAKRIIDPNADASKNPLSGHKPMSSFLSMLALAVAYANGHRYIIASNEKSADEENIVIDGFAINHQFTKTTHYEQMLMAVLASRGFEQRYFSILRPLKDVQILSIFANYPQYHSLFVSCNKGIASDEWCRSCSKCAFVLAAMYGHDTQIAENVWGPAKEVLNEPSLQPEIIELINPDLKPLECIGTTGENVFIIRTLLEKDLLQVTDPDLSRKLQSYLDATAAESFDPNDIDLEYNNFPDELSETLKQSIDTLLPRQ